MKLNTILTIIGVLIVVAGVGFGVFYGLQWLNPVNKPTNNTTDDTSDDVADTGGNELNSTSNFSIEDQTVGESTNTASYTLTDVTGSDMGGNFYRVVFSITPKEASNKTVPYVTAKYQGGSGVIRVELAGITSDTSEIAYQDNLEINNKGVVQVFHNVSTVKDHEWYDVGVTDETPFLLSSDADTTTPGNWLVYLNVKYPGSSNTNIDLGSTTYSLNAQEIVGAVSTDGAKISSYSFVSSNGVLQIIWNVSGSVDKPIPSAKAEYTDFTRLVVTFPSLEGDTVASGTSPISLPGNTTLSWKKNGAISTYTLDGASKTYKLHASTNPNQVILEVKLK